MLLLRDTMLFLRENRASLWANCVFLQGIIFSNENLGILIISVSALLRSYRHQLVRHSRYDLGEAFGSLCGPICVFFKLFNMFFCVVLDPPCVLLGFFLSSLNLNSFYMLEL